MALIGTVEKMHVANVLMRMEQYKKTGLFIVKQDTRWVEFYCHEGTLTCIGPIRADAMLGERLLHDGIISEQALKEAIFTIGNAVQSEMRMALTLVELGYVSKDELQSWTAKNVLDILMVIRTWKTGELYFEENISPSLDRLTVSLQISTLVASLPTRMAASEETKLIQERREDVVLVSTQVPKVSTFTSNATSTMALYEPSQFASEPTTPPMTPKVSVHALVPMQRTAMDTGPVHPSSFTHTPPQVPLVSPQMYQSARRIASFMQPQMVLVPTDTATLPNQEIQVTPEQWRLLARVDGRASLQDVRHALQMRADEICMLAGELIVEQLVNALPDAVSEYPEMPPVPYGAMSNGLIGPGFATTMQTPWASVLPISDVLPSLPAKGETRSQWGNGGSGVTLQSGEGWLVPIQPLQPIGF